MRFGREQKFSLINSTFPHQMAPRSPTAAPKKKKAQARKPTPKELAKQKYQKSLEVHKVPTYVDEPVVDSSPALKNRCWIQSAHPRGCNVSKARRKAKSSCMRMR